MKCRKRARRTHVRAHPYVGDIGKGTATKPQIGQMNLAYVAPRSIAGSEFREWASLFQYACTIEHRLPVLDGAARSSWWKVAHEIYVSYDISELVLEDVKLLVQFADEVG